MADFYTYRLKAGVPIQAAVSGKMILVDDIAGAVGVDITPITNGGQGRTMPARRKAFKCWVDYDGVELQSAVDCTVNIWLSTKDVSLGFADGANVNVQGQVQITNDVAKRVPVEIGGSTVNVTASNVGINNNDALAIPVRAQALSTLVHRPAVIVNNGAATALVSDPTLRKLTILNSGADGKVALGGADVTMSNAAIILEPGDTWIEDNAAGAAWYATSDIPGVEVRVMGVK